MFQLYLQRTNCLTQYVNQIRYGPNLCERFGFKSLTSVTRTRGRKSFKTIYISNLCVECRMAGSGTGTVVIDTNGGSFTRMYGRSSAAGSLVCICADCFAVVAKTSTWSVRSKFCLHNAKRRLPYHTWHSLLNKIPYNDSRNALTKRRKIGTNGPSNAAGTNADAGAGAGAGVITDTGVVQGDGDDDNNNDDDDDTNLGSVYDGGSSSNQNKRSRKTTSGPPKKTSEDFEGAFHNDYLLTKLGI